MPASLPEIPCLRRGGTGHIVIEPQQAHHRSGSRTFPPATCGSLPCHRPDPARSGRWRDRAPVRVHAGRITIEHVTRLDDPRLQDYRHLRDPSRRAGIEQAQGIFTVEGHLSVAALLASAYAVRSILVTDAHAARYADVDVPVFALPSREIEQLTGVHFHRGVLAAADRPDLPSLEELTGSAHRLVVLEAVNDHENIGALFRNAAAFGVDAVVLDPTTADPLYRRATRVSLGHVLRVPFARATTWPEALDDLRRLGFTLVALSPGADETLADLVAGAPGRTALLLGAEGDGLSAAALAAVDRHVRIPMAPGVDSINVATAAAIALAALFQPPQ